MEGFTLEPPANHCKVLAPLSDEFSTIVYDEWGAGGIVFLILPGLFSLISIAVYAEEVCYILRKSNSKDLRNSLLWLLAVQPFIILTATVGVFIPRALVYLTCIFNIFFAYANYKYYYLIMTFAGGSKSFVEKSSHQKIGTNLVPCCCCICLPSIYNSMRANDMAKWFIFQNVMILPFCGALSMILKSDQKLYSLNGTSAAVYIAAIRGASSLFSIYGFKMIARFSKLIEGMEELHAIKGKTFCMQLTMFIIGFEGIIFNIMEQEGVFPCAAPFAFTSRVKAISNYAIICQCFLLVYPMRKFYRRREDIERQAVLTDDISLASSSAAARHNDFHNIVAPQQTDQRSDIIRRDEGEKVPADAAIAADLRHAASYGSASDFLSLRDDDDATVDGDVEVATTSAAAGDSSDV